MGFRKALCLIAGITALVSTVTPAWAAPASKEALLEAVKAAVAAKDVKAIDALFNEENADPEMSAMSRGMAAQMVQSVVNGVALLPLKPDFNDKIVMGTTVYTPNVTPQGYVEFDMGGEFSGKMSMLYGEKDGAYYLALNTKSSVN